uniref:Kelch domain containing 1 n=1 Tax=Myripristis murdjan TaxID=586833 RepID=A0A667ZE71_9TELE
MDSAFERHCSELVARERSGHTALLLDQLLYVWGGYVSIADDEVFLPNDEVWVYDLERGVWEVFRMTGEVPPSMSGTCGCSLNGHMYIFGGCDDDGQTNQIYCVNLSDGKYEWKKITHDGGSPPSPRDKLSCWVHNGSKIVFIAPLKRSLHCFQVEDVFWGWNNEVHMFDPTQASWSEPIHAQGRAPAPRAAHASATLGNKGYVCGGRVMETRTSDIHCLDLDSWTWSEIVPASAIPVGRSWHTLTAVSDSALFLFGGLSSAPRRLQCASTWTHVDPPCFSLS